MSDQSTIAPVVYKDIPGFTGYRVGDDGSVWSCRKNRRRLKGRGFEFFFSNEWKRLSPGKDRTGHLYVCLYSSDKVRSWPYVHELVLEAFVGTRPFGMEGCHFPERSPADNRLENLRWDTPKGNSQDKKKHGTIRRGELSGTAKLNDKIIKQIFKMASTGMPQVGISDILGIPRRHLGKILRREIWAHVKIYD